MMKQRIKSKRWWCFLLFAMVHDCICIGMWLTLERHVCVQGEFSQLWEETKKVERKDEKPCKVVRSGFRICKPQGTFLWPNNGGSMSPQVQMQVEDLLAVPTPTSASSATSPPNPFQLPGSPAKASLPKIRTVAVSCVRPDSAPQGAHNCINTWKQLFDDSGRLPQVYNSNHTVVCKSLVED